MNVYSKISNLIKRAVVTLTNKDSGQFAATQVQWMRDKVAITEVVHPYGLSSNAPVDSFALMFNVMGQEENRAAIVYAPQRRFKDLKEGEVALGNFLTRSVVKFLENGDIEITGTADQNINITGSNNVTIGGDNTIAITGDNTVTVGGDNDVTISGSNTVDITDFNDVTIGGNNTVVVTGNDSVTISGNSILDVTGDADITVGGSTTIDSTGNIDITAPIVSITGELRVTGEVSAFYGLGTELSFSDVRTKYNVHFHDAQGEFAGTTDPNNNL